MNDFTKAELLDIQFVLEDWYRHECKKDKAPHDKLFKKIKSMVDNYCEHDFQPVLGQFQIESCHKCMRVK